MTAKGRNVDFDFTFFQNGRRWAGKMSAAWKGEKEKKATEVFANV